MTIGHKKRARLSRVLGPGWPAPGLGPARPLFRPEPGGREEVARAWKRRRFARPAEPAIGPIGSVFATVAWIGASFLFFWFLGLFTNYTATYGSLGAAVGLPAASTASARARVV